jgi:membrane protein DedA with SNARE-associated domain/rhodanese-related sulfurtransferase
MSITHLLLQHGYYFVFVYVFLVGIGLPIPADPLLLIMGALVGDHHYGLGGAFMAALVPAVAADYMWYEVGRMKGSSVLRLLCRITIEPDTCVRTAETTFTRRGVKTLYFAKFVPGLSLISMPMAGIIGMSRRRFLVADTIGCGLWVSAYMLTGVLFHRYVESLIVQLGFFGQRAGVVVAFLLACFIGFKWLQRWRILRELRVNRISPLEVRELQETSKGLMIVDLRNAAEIAREAYKIPGAVVKRPEDLKALAQEIPPDQEIILYCTCPNEVTSARVAMQMKKAGFRRVRPLEGGLAAWRGHGFPIEQIPSEIDLAVIPGSEGATSSAVSERVGKL